MPERCCVCGYRKRRGAKVREQGIRFHRLPTNEHQRAAWIRAIDRANFEARSWHRVCSAHFVSGWPSDDTEDVDYCPSVDVKGKESRQKRRRQQRVQRRQTMLQTAVQAHNGSEEGFMPGSLRMRDVSAAPRKCEDPSPLARQGKGKPAYEMLDLDPDWAPSLHLGHNEGKSSKSGRPSQSKKKRKRRLTEERPAEGFNGRFDGQREAGVLLREDEPNQPEDQEQNQPAEKRTNISFRDFFRNALEASLEASIRSKAQSKNRSLSSEYEVELNLKLPPAADEECSSSSTCLNCVRLQKRIQELENKLFRLTADQQDVDPSLGPIEQEPIPSPDEDEEENFDEGECVSPSQVALQIIDEDSKSASSLFDWHPSSSGPPSSSLPPSIPSGRHRPPPRFRKEWLSQFPFLRYSQSQDVMWCHVCRIQSDETHQNLGLIKGSKDFKKSSLNKHSNTKYHRDNMERYSWSCKL